MTQNHIMLASNKTYGEVILAKLAELESDDEFNEKTSKGTGLRFAHLILWEVLEEATVREASK